MHISDFYPTFPKVWKKKQKAKAIRYIGHGMAYPGCPSTTSFNSNAMSIIHGTNSMSRLRSSSCNNHPHAGRNRRVGQMPKKEMRDGSPSVIDRFIHSFVDHIPCTLSQPAEAPVGNNVMQDRMRGKNRTCKKEKEGTKRSIDQT